MFNIVSNAISTHKFTFSLFSNFCAECFLAAIAFFVMLCMNIISFHLGIVLLAVSLGFGTLILKLYTIRVPYHIRKEAAISFVLHGVYINIKVLMFISLVLIPMVILLSNAGVYRYELMLIDGVWVNVRYKE